LTDNEKTVTTAHVAGLPVRNPNMVAFARHYGITIHTCQPCDPASKGGSESTVKIAKADLVPKDTNLLEAYDSFADLEAACEAFCAEVNARVHRVTRRAPDEMLAAEQTRLHPVPASAHSVALGVTRTVPAKMPMVSYDGGMYSVPCELLGKTVWVRVHGAGDQELPVGSLQERVGVAAGEQPRGRLGSPGGAERGLVVVEDPRFAGGRLHARQRRAERVERRAAGGRRADPGPLREGRGRRRPEHVQVAAGELESRLAGVDVRPRHGPHGWLSGTVPADEHRPGRRGVPEAVRRHAQPAPGFAVRHPAAVQEGIEPAGEIVGAATAQVVVGEATEGEDGQVLRGDDVRAEPRTPELGERRIRPGVRCRPVDAGVDREDGGPRHTVLQARPGGAPERRGARRQPLVQRPDAPSVPEDLFTGELEPGNRHVG